MLVNTSRGGLVDTAALGRALDTQKIACVGMDVYEHEAGLFFEDKSEETDATPGSSLSPDWVIVYVRSFCNQRCFEFR